MLSSGDGSSQDHAPRPHVEGPLAWDRLVAELYAEAVLSFSFRLSLTSDQPVNMPTQHWFQFPLLDLPIEIQRLIFYHYLGGSYDITLEHERLTMLRSRFSITGIPSYDLLLTCKHFYEHAGPMRRSLFTGSLILHSVFILVPLKRQDRFRWLRENVQCLHFSDSSVHPERWSTYYESFRNLRRLEIDFPLVRKLLSSATSGQGDGGGIKLEDVLEGKEDTLLSTSLDELQMSLLASLSTGRLEVFVTQKYNIPPGLGLASMDAVQKGNVVS